MNANEILAKLPLHLSSLIVDQNYKLYTSEDHAVWRFVMQQNVKYLKDIAHESYLEGLESTGIELDQIPDMASMNECLNKIGWAAVAVDGFIPPDAFMEFQAYNVLVIAAGIRQIDHITYTPAPDIIHESAGHAPIIACEEYAAYLKRFGEIGCKAFTSAHAHKVYNAIRHLSIIKEAPETTSEEIEKAETELAELEKTKSYVSELDEIRNLHWWTVEYGLIGDMNSPKIYGAGLLSSIGESKHCLTDKVKKLPYSIEAANYSFDITTKQPQLFVTPDFKMLMDVLEQHADTMAFRKGGAYAMEVAIASENLGTAVYSSGLQVQGVFTELIKDRLENPAYIKTTGATALAFNNQELSGHSKTYHEHGFGSPVGFIKGCNTPPELLSNEELKSLGIIKGEMCSFEFTSGVKVSGRLKDSLRREEKLLILAFEECNVLLDDQILFAPEWGTFDMAVGAEIVSAFNGLADPEAWEFAYPVPSEKTIVSNYIRGREDIFNLYDQIRKIRERKLPKEQVYLIYKEIRNKYSSEWLLIFELLEVWRQYKLDKSIQMEIESLLMRSLDGKPEIQKFEILNLELH